MNLLLLGDISPTIANYDHFKNESIDYLFNDTLSLFKDKDFVLANLECAITDHETPIKKFGPPLKAPYNTAKVLKSIGVTHLCLSNNHIFDFGKKGIEDTYKALNDHKLGYTGFGKNYEDSRKNLVLEKDGQKIAIICVCEHEYSYALSDRMGSRPFEIYDTIYDIENAKKECDRVIVTYHGGKEESRYPSPRLIKVCRAMAKAGADVILCQHSHCIGCYEKIDGCHILYGQGNFHFVKTEHIPPIKIPYWENALAVNYNTENNNIEFIPTVSIIDRIELAKGEEKERILKEFEERNEELKNGKWKDGWHKFCESKRDDYTKIIMGNDIDNIAHYLDCEAHTDVWHELFPTWNHTNEK